MPVYDQRPEIIEETYTFCVPWKKQSIRSIWIGSYKKSLMSIRVAVKLLEVIYAILAVKGVSMEEFEGLRLEKKADRGGFEKRLFLESGSGS